VLAIACRDTLVCDIARDGITDAIALGGIPDARGITDASRTNFCGGIACDALPRSKSAISSNSARTCDQRDFAARLQFRASGARWQFRRCGISSN
jgi:hypothetical protein